MILNGLKFITRWLKTQTKNDGEEEEEDEDEETALEQNQANAIDNSHWKLMVQ